MQYRYKRLRQLNEIILKSGNKVTAKSGNKGNGKKFTGDATFLRKVSSSIRTEKIIVQQDGK